MWLCYIIYSNTIDKYHVGLQMILIGDSKGILKVGADLQKKEHLVDQQPILD